MGLLRVSVFGTVRIVHEEPGSEIKISPTSQALLAYLLLHGPRFHSRERLADLFWGDYSQERARGCLNTALWRLRCALEPEGVRPETYLLNGPSGGLGFNWESRHWLDVKVFEETVAPLVARPAQSLTAVESQSLEEALDLYTGDLLESYYHDWAIREQERLRCLYLDALEQLMRYYQKHGLYPEALSHGQRLLKYDSLHEEIHREVMSIYLADGQRAQAIRQYKLCRAILASEMDLEPMPETQARYARAKEGLVRDGSSQKPHPDRVGRVRRQLSLALKEFDEAQEQLSLASGRLEQAQQQLQQVLQLFGEAA